jgi:hypothetical protein
MSFSPDVVPVYKLTNPRRVYSYTVEIDGVSTTQTDIRTDASDMPLLSGAIVFGAPDGTVAYDVPAWDADLSRSPTTRRGPTYAAFTNASCMTQTCWKAANGIDFDALQGAVGHMNRLYPTRD